LESLRKTNENLKREQVNHEETKKLHETDRERFVQLQADFKAMQEKLSGLETAKMEYENMKK
jgi:hypothetical protein